MPDLITSLYPFFGLLIILVVVVGAIFAFTQKRKPITSYPYQKQDRLFTPAERSFLGVMEQALGDQHRVFGKVRLADVIEVKSGVSRSVRQSAFNRIQAKHLDYVVCDPDDLSIQFAVELDDSSHSQTKRKNRDAFVDQANDSIGLTPGFERVTQTKLIIETLTKSKGALTTAELAARLMSKSKVHAGLLLNNLISSGDVVRVDNQTYTTPEKAFLDIDVESILCMIDDILLGSGKTVECDVFRLKINRELKLSFPKYFYASLASLNVDEFGWYRVGNLFSFNKIDVQNMRGYCEQYCDQKKTNVENLDKLRKYVDFTEQVGVNTLYAWKSSKSTDYPHSQHNC